MGAAKKGGIAMAKSKSFTERRRRLLAQAPESGGSPPAEDGAVDDWNNFPNYLKFSSFANASVPNRKVEPKKQE
jgi:hypothetical protein